MKYRLRQIDGEPPAGGPVTAEFEAEDIGQAERFVRREWPDLHFFQITEAVGDKPASLVAMGRVLA